MTIASATSLDSIRAKLCEVCDLLDLAIKAADCPNPEWTAIKHAWKMADDLVGDLNDIQPCDLTGADAMADLRIALWHPAVSTGMDRLEMDFRRQRLTLHHTGKPGVAATLHCGAVEGHPSYPEVTPEDGPLEPEGEPMALAQRQAG